MELLINWVTQIIIFILLALIIELFIPSTKLMKYIRLVFGLIFILIFLKPLFYLFQIDIESAISQQLTRQMLDDPAYQRTETRIEGQNKQIQAVNDAYVLDEVTDQLKKIAEPYLDQDELKIQHIDYHFNKSTRSYESLEKIVVYIQAQEDESSVKQIENIKIDLKENLDEQQTEQTLDQIKNTLVQVWELSDEELAVRWGSIEQ